jgi:hypothetical protein
LTSFAHRGYLCRVHKGSSRDPIGPREAMSETDEDEERLRPDGGGERRTRAIALSTLVVVWLAFDYPALTGRVLFPVAAAEAASPYKLYGAEADASYKVIEGDAFNQFLPLRTYLGRRLRAGSVPLWDPHRLAGVPFAAHPQAGVWYPPNWLFGVTDAVIAFSWLAVLSRLGALLLFYWFLRVLGLHPYASVLGSVIFTFSAFFSVWTLHPTFIASGMWFPLAAGGITVALRERPARGVGLAAIGLGLSVVGGHPQIAVYVWFAALVWATIQVAADMRGARRGGDPLWRPLRRGIGLTASAFVLGGALAAPQVLSSLEVNRYIVRQEEPFENVQRNALPGRHLTTLVLPDRLGNPYDRNYLPGRFLNYTETALYAGVVSLVLALLAAWLHRGRSTLAFLVLGVVGGLAAFGTIAYRVLFETVPFLSQTRIPTRIVFLLDVSIAGLAALGLNVLLGKGPDAERPTLVVAGGVAAAIGMAALLDVPGLPPSYVLPQVVKAAILLGLGTLVIVVIISRVGTVGLGAMALIALAAADLWMFGFGYHPFEQRAPVLPRVPELAFLESVPGVRPRFVRRGGWNLPPNIGLVHDLYEIQLYDNVIPAPMVELLSVAQPNQREFARRRNTIGFFDRKALRSPILDLLGVRHVVGRRGSSLGQPSFNGALAIFPRSRSFPPAIAVPCWRYVPQSSMLRSLRGMASSELRSTVLLFDEAAVRSAAGRPSTAGCGTAGSVEVLRYEPEGVTLEVIAPRRSIVLLSDAWYPGWTARLDGSPAPILRADWALRGVPVPAGRHRIEMAYRPWWLPAGASLTALSLVIVATCIWLRRSVDRRRKPVG